VGRVSQHSCGSCVAAQLWVVCRSTAVGRAHLLKSFVSCMNAPTAIMMAVDTQCAVLRCAVLCCAVLRWSQLLLDVGLGMSNVRGVEGMRVEGMTIEG
jgi:hypothetical protein